MHDIDIRQRAVLQLEHDAEQDLVLTGLGLRTGPVPANAAYAVEARPIRHAAPLVFLFAAETEALRFAERIAGWPGPRPLAGRILADADACRGARAVPVGEAPFALMIEEIAPEDGRPW